MPRKVMVLTGKRGGFGAMKPMLRLLRDDPAFELQLVVTDQHLDPRFGRTITEVEREFSIAAAVDMEQRDGTAAGRARALGVCATRMAETLDALKPDLCLLYGDRGEVLASAMAATAMSIPIGHMQGGDVSGSVDEQVRHAVTKLAHLHFPSTRESAERILKMGEEPWRVVVTGDHHLDLIVAGEYAAKSEVAEATGIDPDQPAIVLLQHSETTAPDQAYQQMAETLLAVRDTGMQVVVVYPCSDVGYEGIVQAIEEFATGPQFRVFKNLEAPLFWGLLATASIMVGNSSAGIIETPCFRLPAINIGRRQENRLHAENVIHAEHDRNTIMAAIDHALNNESFRESTHMCRQVYGDGTAGWRTVEAIRNLPLDNRLLVKRMTY
ncbi:MAG: UDP-N-acetylglucosamine 2-epimerase [Gallionellaceae bacterium]|nr:UDP-N-acetylglucosamine 2-epimerase [Gallionellaceae bacterium]